MDRHLPGIVLRRKGRILLFDSGEGTQHRLMEGGLKITRVDAVFITHLHGDHWFGLMGLLATQTMHQRKEAVHVIGPEGIREGLQRIIALSDMEPSFDLRFTEMVGSDQPQIVYEQPEFYVEARSVDHGVPTWGYRFQERDRPGRLNPDRAQELGVTEPQQFQALKDGRTVTGSDGRSVTPDEVLGPTRPGTAFAYVTDTRPCRNAVELARNAEVLYHEATFEDDLSERAKQTGHSTALQAANVAAEANARRLLLGHFSARYTDPGSLRVEAQSVFPQTDIVEELAFYTMPAYRTPVDPSGD